MDLWRSAVPDAPRPCASWRRRAGDAAAPDGLEGLTSAAATAMFTGVCALATVTSIVKALSVSNVMAERSLCRVELVAAVTSAVKDRV